VSGLHDLRRTAGEPSYAELARGVSALRQSRGQDEHSSRVARTTVYDAFRFGRSRVDVGLVRDLATVMRAPDSLVDEWLAAGRHGEPVPLPVEDPPPAEDASPPGPSRRLVAVLVLGCVLTNLLGRFVVDALHLPIYLDMAGTAVAALALGPWVGVGVGLTSNGLGVLSSGGASLPFGLVNAVGALVWGYGVRRGLGLTLPRFFGLNLLVAIACSAVALPILGLLYAGSTGHAEDGVAASLEAIGQSLPVAVVGANVLVSVADKTISGSVALVALSFLPWARRRGLEVLPPPA
jgi:energy-coupling factor transport system substrate-specific component